MPSPFEFFPKYEPAVCWALDSLTYQAGPATFDNGAYFQVTNIANIAVTEDEAKALLAAFQKIGYKNAVGITSKQGNVITYTVLDSTDKRNVWGLYGANNFYEGLLSGYVAAMYAYNDVNGGGVGNPGSWTLPHGAYEPVWTPTPHTPPKS